MVDKKEIKKNFSKKSRNYDKFAEVQKSTANKVLELASPFINKNSKILDLGSGSSFLAKSLTNNYVVELDLSLEMLKSWKDRPKNIIPIQGDFEDLPFEKNSFDIVLSSFSLQWAEDFNKLFKGVSSILKNNGKLIFAIPTSESLEELRIASSKSRCNFHFKELPETNLLEKSLLGSGLNKIDIIQDKTFQNFSSGIEALHSIKNIGANQTVKRRNLINKTNLKEFNDFCLKNFTIMNRSSSTSEISISWNICYFIFTKII